MYRTSGARKIENGNTIIPILIDNDENAFSEEDIETLSKKLLKTNCKRIRRWIKDCGKENLNLLKGLL